MQNFSLSFSSLNSDLNCKSFLDSNKQKLTVSQSDPGSEPLHSLVSSRVEVVNGRVSFDVQQQGRDAGQHKQKLMYK